MEKEGWMCLLIHLLDLGKCWGMLFLDCSFKEKLEIELFSENKSGGHRFITLRRMEKLENAYAKKNGRKH